MSTRKSKIKVWTNGVCREQEVEVEDRKQGEEKDA